MYIGPTGNVSNAVGSFNMTGGSLTVANLVIGYPYLSATPPISSSSSGTFSGTNSNPPQINVTNSMTVGLRGFITGSTSINMSGANFYDYKFNDNLSNLSLFFTNPTASDYLNFADELTLGTLNLTGGATLYLEDLLTKPNLKFLYVDNLILGQNSNLYLDGLTLEYTYESGIGSANINLGGGTLEPAPGVPLPASVWLLLSGLAGLAGLRRIRS